MLLNKTPKTDWTPGDTVAYVNSENVIKAGYVVSIAGNEARIKTDEPIGFVYVPVNALFENVAKAQNAIHQRDSELYNQYLDEITTVGALVKFAYMHGLKPGTETDSIAATVYRKKARELLNIDLTAY